MIISTRYLHDGSVHIFEAYARIGPPTEEEIDIIKKLDTATNGINLKISELIKSEIHWKEKMVIAPINFNVISTLPSKQLSRICPFRETIRLSRELWNNIRASRAVEEDLALKEWIADRNRSNAEFKYQRRVIANKVRRQKNTEDITRITRTAVAGTDAHAR